MTVFEYDAKILADFPDLTGGVLIASGLNSGATPPALLERYNAEQQAALARIGDTLLSQIESLAAWRVDRSNLVWSTVGIHQSERNSIIMIKTR